LWLIEALAVNAVFAAPQAASPAAAAPGAATAAQQAVPAQSAAIGLDAARSQAKAAGPALAAKLAELEAELPPRDALTLLGEFLPSLSSPAERSGCAAQAGDLALLLGLFSQAADYYERASSLAEGGRDPALLLKSARARLACGEADKATDLASLVLLSSADAGLSARARLVGAWALALQGRNPEARAMALAIAGQPAKELPPELRREARFLAWASSPPESRNAARDDLAREFPGSAEALAASGGLPLAPLPHWYLGGLSAAGALDADALGASRAAPAKEAPVAAAPAEQKPPADAPAPAVKDAPAAAQSAEAAKAVVAKRFQVGYFSKEENAAAMKAKLASLGFVAVVEPRPQVKAKPGDDGRRWAVIVEGGKDPERTQARLKDADFESYPLF
jgi:hypothetical protein